MKKIMKPVLVCILLVLTLLIQASTPAKAASKTYYYLSVKSHAPYENQPILVVQNTIDWDANYTFSVQMPVMEKVTKIIFKKAIKEIPPDLFKKCPNVTTIEIRKEVKSIWNFHHLCDLKKLKTIKVEAGSKSYKAVNNVLYSYNKKELIAYPNAKKDTTYTMPSTVQEGLIYAGTNQYLTKIQLGKNFDSYELYKSDKAYFPKVTAFTVAKGNQFLKAKDGVLYNHTMKSMVLYPNGKKNTTFTVPSSVKTLDSCFGTNKYMKTLTIGKNVSKFKEDYKTNSVILPKLTNIKVTKGNKYYTNYNGTLYTIKTKKLVFCARGKVKPYTVKAGTKIIVSGAFNNSKITSITFPSSLIEIEASAFRNSALTTLKLPASIQSFDCYSINDMHKLKAITVKDGCKNFYAKAGILYKNDGVIAAWPEKCHVTKLTLNADRNGLAYLGENTNEKYVETLIVGKDVKDISIYGSLNKLKKIELDSENTALHLSDGVLYNADYSKIVLYPNCNPDTQITLHENLKELNQIWFSGKNNTEELILPDGLEKIVTRYSSAEDNATCEAGKETEDLDATESRQDDEDVNERDVIIAFKKSLFPNLKKITISSDNANFTCMDNVLYNKDMTELVWYPVNRDAAEYTLPDTVTKLNAQLREAKNLKTLTLNNAVKSTLDYIGAYSDSIEAIIVPEDNTDYVTVDGVLYSKDMTRMIVYPNGKADTSYKMPDSVTEARFNWTNTHLQEITLSANLTKVIRYPEIFDTVFETKYFSTGVFGGFTALKTVNGLRSGIKFWYLY